MRKLLKFFLSKTNYHIIKTPKFNGNTQFKIDEFHYGVITPAAGYSPWLEDVEFEKVYLQIKGNTLVDIYRCFELWEIVENVNKLNKDAALIEIGAWKGGTAAIISKKLALLNSKSTFYVADTFSGVAKASKKDKFYNGGEHADTSQEIVESLLKDKYQNYKILKGIFPDETAQTIPFGEVFSFCHIDVDVYESANGIVDWIWDKMIVGGVVVFDDYGFYTCNGITRFVNEQKKLTDRVIIHNLNGHALMIKLK